MGHKILWKPSKFIDERTSKDFARDGYWFSLWSSIVYGLVFVLLSIVISPTPNIIWRDVVITFAIVFAITYVGQILLGYITKEVVGLLKKEISFAKALASVGYSSFLVSVSLASISILALFPGVNVLAPLVGVVFLVRAYGIYIRFLHEYASLNVVEAYVASIIIITAFIVGLSVGYNIVGVVSLSMFV